MSRPNPSIKNYEKNQNIPLMNVMSNNAQNNNIPLSFNEKVTNKNNNPSNVNYMIFGDLGVEKTFIPLNQPNGNQINSKMLSNIPKGQNSQNKNGNDFRAIQQSFKKNEENFKKSNTIFYPKESKNKNLVNSISNNQSKYGISASEFANKKNPFYRSHNSDINQSNNNKSKAPFKQLNNPNNMNNNNFNIGQNQLFLDPLNIMINNQINQNNKNNIENNYHDKIHHQLNQNVNQQNPNKIKKEESYSFSRYKRAAKTGLRNLGNNSYLNSVLQLICSIRNFGSYFLNPKNGDFFEQKVDKYPLSYVIHRLCFHLYPFPETGQREIYHADSVMQILGEYNIIYKNHDEKNPNEFIVFLLDKLHDELNSKKKNKNVEINIDSIKMDKNAIINQGLKDFMNNNNSIISNYFSWLEIKNTQCCNCWKNIYSFQNFQTFELNISDCYKSKKIKEIKIENCLEIYEKDKIKKNFCSYCGNYEKNTTKTTIYSSPNIFIFLLDLNLNSNIKFIIEQQINLNKFIENKAAPLTYELKGIVFYDQYKKKYNTLCVSPVDKNWYLYDDENVEFTKFDEFVNSYNKNNIYQPFILLYSGLVKK